MAMVYGLCGVEVGSVVVSTILEYAGIWDRGSGGSGNSLSGCIRYRFEKPVGG